MAKRKPRRYFDSDVLIRYFEGDREAAPIVQALLDEAQSEKWTVAVAAHSLLEVTRPKNKPVDPAKVAKITSFFEQDYVHVRDLDVTLAENALRLIYGYLWLHPLDAAHLAAAIDMKCEVFYTFEDEIVERFNGEQGLAVQRPERPKGPEISDLPLFQTLQE